MPNIKCPACDDGLRNDQVCRTCKGTGHIITPDPPTAKKPVEFDIEKILAEKDSDSPINFKNIARNSLSADVLLTTLRNMGIECTMTGAKALYDSAHNHDG